ncbi:MAG: RusA family crossover junction endodeoxyribonuclease [Proteobacteria bacterium]|jgi:crossover junction endodeoxyribonuclease RusA|nr:RusA family crossover junction endodeoxyribonuclease [Pseudomonadota bacterium]
MSKRIQFTAYGIPQPKGSTKSFVVKGRAITTSANAKVKPWQEIVAYAAQQHRPPEIWVGGIGIRLDFYFLRPKSVSEKKRPYHTVKPDVDKITRSTLDALTGVIFADDSQVVSLIAGKEYGDPRVDVQIWEV